jgi:hypothetical protein
MEPQRDDRTINRFVGEGDGLRRKISWRVFEMAEQGKESLIDLVAFARLVVDEPDSTLKRTLQGGPSAFGDAGRLSTPVGRFGRAMTECWANRDFFAWL